MITFFFIVYVFPMLQFPYLNLACLFSIVAMISCYVFFMWNMVFLLCFCWGSVKFRLGGWACRGVRVGEALYTLDLALLLRLVFLLL